MDKLNSTNVKAAGWLDGNEDVWVGRDLTSNNNFLLVTTGKSRSLMICALCRTNIKLVNELLSEFFDLYQVKCNTLTKGLLVVALKHHVLGNRKGQNQTPTVTV